MKTAGLMASLFFFGPVLGQKSENFGFNFTPRSGINFSYAGEDAQETKAFKLSPEGGIAIKLDLNKHLGITTGLHYTQRAKYYQYNRSQSFFQDLSNDFFGGISGVDTLIESLIGVSSDFINDSIYSTYRGKVNIHYLQVPLMATLDIGDFSLSAGAYIGFKLNARATETLTQEFPMLTTLEPLLSDSAIAPIIDFFTLQYPGLKQPSITEKTDLPWVNSTDFGLIAELSARFNQRFMMSTTITYGLRNYSTDPDLYPGKHFGISFNMGLTLGKIKGTAPATKLF